MKRIRKLICVLMVCALSLPVFQASAHTIADGNARAERIRSVSPAPAEVDGYIDYANPTIRAGGWSWMALSLSNPLLGDCHDGSTAPANIRVARVGWIKFAADPIPKFMGAWIGDDQQISLVTTAYMTNQFYYRLIGTSENAWHTWTFQYYNPGAAAYVNIALTDTGPTVTQMKCITVGGWTSSFSNAIGSAAITGVTSRYYNSSTFSAFSPGHAVINSPYQAPSVAGGWQFYGNN